MSVIIRIFANSVPAIALVLGFLLLFAGMTGGNERLTGAGWLFVIIGFILQVLWIFTRRR